MNSTHPAREQPQRKVFGFNLNIFLLGIVSLLTDISSEMIFTLLPLFLSNVLGAATTIVGLVGGLSDGADAILRIFSGWFSDKMQKRKYLATLGYGLSTIAKPFMLMASTWGAVLVIRTGDRLGKGIRSSPRDALLADSAPANERGRSFGLHKAMDTFGAMVGLILAAVIIYLVQGTSSLMLGLPTYRWFVLVGIVPAIIAVLILLAFVRETPRRNNVNSAQPRLSWRLEGFDSRFKVFLVIIFIFTLGNSSDFFIILRAQNLGAPLLQVTLMLVLFNITYSLIALPAGILSDRLGRKRVIALGWFIYALSYLGFALTSSMWQIWLLFAIYGTYYGIVEGVARAFVADVVPAERRGTAFGIYNGVTGLTLLAASLLAGWLWDVVSPAAPFYFGAGLAFLAMLGLITMLKR